MFHKSKICSFILAVLSLITAFTVDNPLYAKAGIGRSSPLITHVLVITVAMTNVMEPVKINRRLGSEEQVEED